MWYVPDYIHIIEWKYVGVYVLIIKQNSHIFGQNVFGFMHFFWYSGVINILKRDSNAMGKLAYPTCTAHAQKNAFDDIVCTIYYIYIFFYQSAVPNLRSDLFSGFHSVAIFRVL